MYRRHPALGCLQGLGWAPAWVCLTLLNLPAWLLVWSGIPPYTRWMQPTLFLLLASVVSVPLAGRYECTPWSAAQHAAVAALILAVAVGQFAFYDVPFRSFDIEHLDATIAQARELAGQLQALGLLRLNYLATAVISRLQHTAAHAVVAGHSR